MDKDRVIGSAGQLTGFLAACIWRRPIEAIRSPENDAARF